MTPIALALILAATPPVGTPLIALEPIASAPSTPPLGTPLIALQPVGPTASSSSTSGGSAEVDATVSSEPRSPWFGAQIDAGFPEGFGASAIFRPWYFVRAQFGVVTNTAAPGIRGGLTLIPFRFAITPTASFEAGHLFEGDLNGTVQSVLSNAKMPDGVLNRVSYDFYTGELGLELGSPDRFIIYLRGGLSRVNATLKGPPKQVSSSTKVDPGEVHLGLTVPSAKLGLLLYF